MTTYAGSPTDTLQYALDFFAVADEALRDEIAEQRSSEQREATAAFHGRLLMATGSDAFRYQFPMAGMVRLRIGERVQCLVGGSPPVRAVVSACDARSLTLDFEADLGSLIPSATVLRDASWLEEALRRRLELVANQLRRGGHTDPFSIESALMAHHPASAMTPPGFVPLTMPSALEERMAMALNEQQLRAVEVVLERPVAFIAGPPGTGKTTTIAAAVSALVHLNQRILVVTPSNAAADVLLAQLHPWLSEHPLVARGLVQRVGVNLTEHLTPELRELVVPADVVRRIHDEYDAVEEWLDSERVRASAGRADDVGTYSAELEAVCDERQGLAQELARNCRVTVTPIANVFLKPDLWRSFDAVVVEEASMVTLPAFTLAAGLSRARVLVAGDYQQLGTVVTADTPAVRAALRRDAFRVAGMDTMFADDDEPPFAVSLRAQYRMPRQVCTLVSDLYYGGRLRTAHARDFTPVLPGVDAPLVLIDTSRLEPTVERGTRANPVHARVIAGVVNAVKGSLRFSEDASVGVFTLYRDQVACLDRAQRGLASRRADVTATVHRAQGAEVAVAVVDLCDAPGASVTFLRANRCSEEGARLLNVALSRGRVATILVVNVPHLERAGGAVVREVLARVKEQGAVVDASEFLPQSSYVAAHRL